LSSFSGFLTLTCFANSYAAGYGKGGGFITSCVYGSLISPHSSSGNQLGFQGPLLLFKHPPTHVQLPPRNAGRLSASTISNSSYLQLVPTTLILAFTSLSKKYESIDQVAEKSPGALTMTI